MNTMRKRIFSLLPLATMYGCDDPADDRSVSCKPQAMMLFNPAYLWAARKADDAGVAPETYGVLPSHERAFGIDCTAQNAALLARTCVEDGMFHEVVNMKTKEPFGSGSPLWSAAAFVDVCRRARLGVK